MTTVKLFNSALEEKCGCNISNLVNVQLVLNGMEISVFQILVRKAEFGVKNINHVYVLTLKFGMEKNASLLKFPALMDRFGTLPFMHAAVLMDSIIQEVLARKYLSALLECIIIHSIRNALANMNTQVINVLSLNAFQGSFGMDISVLLSLVLLHPIFLMDHVSILVISYVLMVTSGANKNVF